MAKLKTIFILCIFLVFLYSWKFHPFSTYFPPNQESENNPCSIIILLWTKFYGRAFPTEKQFAELFLKDCPSCMENCIVRVVSNRALLNTSDAVVFYAEDLNKNDLPGFRFPNQVWIFYQLESPAYTTPVLFLYSGLFNWTMTYRRDSDIWSPYGRITPLNTSTFSALNNSLKEATRKRTRSVAWLVSHCHTHSKREKYVSELRKYISVDIYGKCGFTCPSNCFKKLQAYKFFLSFENSLCADYITEKYFNALKHNLLPIVYGGTRHSQNQIGPANSFINVRNFSSPKHLAKYLHYLEENEQEYLKYFQWKSKYKIDENDVGWCRLCLKLKQQKLHPIMQSYQQLSQWWNFVNASFEVKNERLRPACE